jgi:bifunctional DNase/RNase
MMKGKRKANVDVLSVLILLFVFALGVLTSYFLIPNSQLGPATDSSQQPSLTGAMIQQLPCMDTTGCVETEISTDDTNVFLRAGCYRLAIATNELQTYSINSGLNGIRGPRPTTHDAIHDMMDIFEMRPLIVKIESLSQGTYFAKMAVTQGTKVLDMDIRPSDAIAIAVRTNAPVWINQTLLEENGEFIC